MRGLLKQASAPEGGFTRSSEELPGQLQGSSGALIAKNFERDGPRNTAIW